ncbi:hypothetical protein GDO81_020957 [Engystomops pustulosus]|uniref:Uncharacterized protein n=1 Tax=Engystomops pustulosus TaxID=76066 RepID=A0AAV6ZHN0_ENGPU|nr:hypothetical protein GDO81_020957 [Engystomops pustulosus]
MSPTEHRTCGEGWPWTRRERWPCGSDGHGQVASDGPGHVASDGPGHGASDGHEHALGSYISVECEGLKMSVSMKLLHGLE